MFLVLTELLRGQAHHKHISLKPLAPHRRKPPGSRPKLPELKPTDSLTISLGNRRVGWRWALRPVAAVSSAVRFENILTFPEMSLSPSKVAPERSPITTQDGARNREQGWNWKPYWSLKGSRGRGQDWLSTWEGLSAVISQHWGQNGRDPQGKGRSSSRRKGSVGGRGRNQTKHPDLGHKHSGHQIRGPKLSGDQHREGF